MEIFDGCIYVEIPYAKLTNPNQVFARAYTEYEVSVGFHTLKYKLFKRYSQFRLLYKELKHEFIFADCYKNLPEFPKKQIFGKKLKATITKRRQNLEKWLNSALQITQFLPHMQNFLEIPEMYQPLVHDFTQSHQCSLSDLDLAVASFIKRLSKSEKKRGKAIERLENEFFNARPDISERTASILLSRLIPLCGIPGVGAKAFDILSKLTSCDMFRYYSLIIDVMMKIDIDLLREMKLNLHLTGKFLAEQAFHLCKIIEEQLTLKSSSNLLIYILNNDNEALEAYRSWTRPLLFIKNSQENNPQNTENWKKLNTQHYSGGLNIKYRKISHLFEMSLEIEIEASIATLVEIITEPALRKKWDSLLLEYDVIENISENESLVSIVFLSDKNEKMDLALSCIINIQENYASVEYASVETPKVPINPQFPRVHCSGSKYEIYDMRNKPEEAQSDGALSDIQGERISGSNEFRSKIVYKTILMPDMTKFLCSEFVEETNFIKSSWKNLKELAESNDFNSFHRTPRAKKNTIIEALEHKVHFHSL
ncbi:unnamed protein product [Blepharisma stoltei]|uniref:PX domain-containing protein n=1 Tax=Blepharisma stoltei TaxID=1481888 RepID=A0AAU9K6A9_9CILI|nr:unnamed protein product [Blepharisma stoltei]